MKKNGLLHSELNKTIAAMGHGDMLVIADTGLPVPVDVPVIDLAFCKGKISFLDALEVIADELEIESYIVAEELQHRNASLIEKIQGILKKPSEQLTHEAFKDLSKGAIAVVRTGEWTPYSNIILVAGVPF
ncbi:D-ribose pyranase [Fodinisporobacter ferrooxydans]|uniref:D-ribose pyranase n=1 Tax=Fodinisporobacter ferrooxydans TaxID=2901836 RepID=A0ABY4CEB2_9BACL|nr:D-ribose pyranase [Alicyclobacillaceae bacterium MYW30-H2]